MSTIINPDKVRSSGEDRPPMAASPSSPPVRWEVSDGLTEYETAVSRMELLASEIASGKTSEQVWLVEHPPLYTAGTSAKDDGLLEPDRFPVFQTGRGGEYTYHGPGQRVAYTMLDLKRRKPDVRVFVTTLEDWIIATLADFNVRAERRAGRIGVWVERPDKPRMPDGSMREEKIAAIGIRLRRWVSFHGISINVDPQLDHFDGIVPCGIADYGVTSLVDLGIPASMNDVDIALKRNFERYFGDIGQSPK